MAEKIETFSDYLNKVVIPQWRDNWKLIAVDCVTLLTKTQSMVVFRVMSQMCDDAILDEFLDAVKLTESKMLDTLASAAKGAALGMNFMRSPLVMGPEDAADYLQDMLDLMKGLAGEAEGGDDLRG